MYFRFCACFKLQYAHASLRSHMNCKHVFASARAMRVLIVDGLNFLMHRFPALWSTSFQVIRSELDALATACHENGVLPLIVLDMYKSGSVGHQKWKRRQRKLLVRSRAVPCSASCLIGSILAETDMAWTYATTMEADDLIIQIAQQVGNCTILSGDKGYLRTFNRKYCVARGCSYNNGFRLIHVTHAGTCSCQKHGTLPDCLKLEQNFSKMRFYMMGIKSQRTVYKGVFYTSFTILPCMWCFLEPLRRHLYYCANVSSVDENHVCATMCQETSQLCWSTARVYARYQPDFDMSCMDAVRRYKAISEGHTHASPDDHDNAVFACAVAVAQTMTDIWYLGRSPLQILDSVAVSKAFMRHLHTLTQK